MLLVSKKSQQFLDYKSAETSEQNKKQLKQIICLVLALTFVLRVEVVCLSHFLYNNHLPREHLRLKQNGPVRKEHMA